GKEVRALCGQQGALDGLAFSGDGKLVGTWDEAGVMRLWDSMTGKLLRELETKAGAVRVFALSPDGKVATTHGTLDMRFRRWDTTTGKDLPFPQHDPQRVGFPAFSPDGRLLAATDYQSAKVIVW